jgi:hypothetical protein
MNQTRRNVTYENLRQLRMQKVLNEEDKKYSDRPRITSFVRKNKSL